MTNPTYRIRLATGTTMTRSTYDDALRAVVALYAGAVTTHPGDLLDGGDRTLCWASEEDAVDDPGTLSIARITVHF